MLCFVFGIEFGGYIKLGFESVDDLFFVWPPRRSALMTLLRQASGATAFRLRSPLHGACKRLPHLLTTIPTSPVRTRVWLALLRCLEILLRFKARVLAGCRPISLFSRSG